MSDTSVVSDTEPMQTAGAMLRSARQAQGLHIAALALQLKVTPRKLESLEADRYDELQGPTFVRALAQATCRALRVDPAPVLARLPAVERHTLDQVSGGLNAPFREHGGRSEVLDLSKGGRWALGFVALLLVAALGMWFLPASLHLSWPWGVAASTAAEGPAPAAPEQVAPANAPEVVAASAMAAPAAPAETRASAAPQASTPVEMSGKVPLLVKAETESWVDVVDGDGNSLLSRTLQAGESIHVDGVLPLRVKIGNAAGTQLNFRGQVVDLASYTRDNIARLELK